MIENNLLVWWLRCQKNLNEDEAGVVPLFREESEPRIFQPYFCLYKKIENASFI